MHRSLCRGTWGACLAAAALWCAVGQGQQPAQTPAFPGLTSDMGSLFRLSDAQPRPNSRAASLTVPYVATATAPFPPPTHSGLLHSASA